MKKKERTFIKENQEELEIDKNKELSDSRVQEEENFSLKAFAESL